MNAVREAVILADIERAACPEFFAGYVSGLRCQGELVGPIPSAIIQKLKENGWEQYEPFPELNPPLRKAG